MHEEDFTKQIVESIITELKKYPGMRPKRVKVIVGEMLHLVPDSVRMHYDLMTKTTDLQAVELELVEKAAIVHCLRCGFEGEVEDHHLLMCAKCGAFNTRLLCGDEISIDEIELEKEGAPTHGKS